MPATVVVAQVLNGLAVGMLYALLALGLSIIKGLLNIPNFAHGAFFALGAYIFYSFAQASGMFWLPLVASAVIVGALGAIIEIVAVRKLYGAAYLFQLLLLFGVALIIGESIILIWGAVGKSISPPLLLQGALHLGGFFYPKYLLFTTLLGGLIIGAVYLLIERTHFGAMIRAGIEKTEMASALGININLLFTAAFALGAGLAALAGGLAAPILGVTSQMGLEMLATAFVVVVIGGLGSLYGSVLGGLVVGLVQSISALFLPSASTLLIYVTMVLILLFRPQGLLGER